jgi:EF hand domain-containing protein
MKKLITLFTVALAFIAWTTTCATAQPPTRGPGPDPGSHFDRLDANEDGFITENEVPKRMGRKGSAAFYPGADTDGDKKVSKEELTDWVEARFDRRKANQDGRPGTGARGMGPDGRPGPWGRGMGPDGWPGPPNPAEVFKRLDTDNNRQLSEEEFIEGTRKLRQQMQGKGYPGGPMPPNARGGPIGGRLLQADTDKDGKVSKAEAVAQFKSRFDQMDADKDGFISDEERRDMWGNFQGGRGPARG